MIRAKDDGRWLIARGVAWVATDTGAVWRAHLFYRHFLEALPDYRAPEAAIEVDFVRNAGLELIVPHEMRETFGAPMGQGEGLPSTPTTAGSRRQRALSRSHDAAARVRSKADGNGGITCGPASRRDRAETRRRSG
jgi:hypothetical protein